MIRLFVPYIVLTSLVGNTLLFGGLRASHAGDDPNQALKNSLSHFREHYQPWLDTSHRNLIRIYFLARAVDFVSALRTLANELIQSKSRYHEVAQEIRRLQQELLQEFNPNLERDAVRYQLLLSAAKNERSVLQTTLKDLAVLEGAWEKRCSDENLDPLIAKFHPDLFYSPNKAASANTPDAQIRITLGIAPDSAAGTASGMTSERATATVLTSALASGVSGALVTGKAITWATLSASSCTGPGIFVGAAVAAVMASVFAAIDVSEVCQQRNEQAALLEDIYNLQRRAIDQQAKQLKTALTTACREVLEECGLRSSIAEYKNTANEYQQELAADAAEIDSNWNTLKEKFSEQINYLEHNYFVRVSREANDVMRQYFERQAQQRSDAMSRARSHIAPALTAVKQTDQDFFTQELELKHFLWNQIIEGDAIYTSGDHFHFGYDAPKSQSIKKIKWNFIIEGLNPFLLFSSLFVSNAFAADEIQTEQWRYYHPAESFVQDHSVHLLKKGSLLGKFEFFGLQDTSNASEENPFKQLLAIEKKIQSQLAILKPDVFARLESPKSETNPVTSGGFNPTEELADANNARFDLTAFRDCARSALRKMKEIIQKQQLLPLTPEDQAGPLRGRIYDLFMDLAMTRTRLDGRNEPSISCGKFLGKSAFQMPTLNDEVKLFSSVLKRSETDQPILLKVALAAYGTQPMSDGFRLPEYVNQLWQMYWKMLSLNAVFSDQSLPSIETLQAQAFTRLEKQVRVFNHAQLNANDFEQITKMGLAYSNDLFRRN